MYLIVYDTDIESLRSAANPITNLENLTISTTRYWFIAYESPDLDGVRDIYYNAYTPHINVKACLFMRSGVAYILSNVVAVKNKNTSVMDTRKNGVNHAREIINAVSRADFYSLPHNPELLRKYDNTAHIENPTDEPASIYPVEPNKYMHLFTISPALNTTIQIGNIIATRDSTISISLVINEF